MFSVSFYWNQRFRSTCTPQKFRMDSIDVKVFGFQFYLKFSNLTVAAAMLLEFIYWFYPAHCARWGILVESCSRLCDSWRSESASRFSWLDGGEFVINWTQSISRDCCCSFNDREVIWPGKTFGAGVICA